MNEHAPPARKPGPNTVARVQPRTDLGRWQPSDNRRELTELQARFAAEYAVNGGNAAEAARAAGYAPSSCKDVGGRILRLPWVQRAVEIERGRFLREAEAAALRYIVDMIRDQAAGPKLRLEAAKIAVVAAGRDRDSQKESAGAGKALSAMTVAELEALVRRLDQAAELAQQPILEHDEQPPAPASAQPIDPAEESTVL